MIRDEAVFEAVGEFDTWVDTERVAWQRYRYAFEDKFWNGQGGESKVITGYPLKLQINQIRPWVFSYVDSLFHKGLRTVVSAPSLPRGDVAALVGRDAAPDAPKPKVAIAKLLDFWMARVEIEETTERGFIMAMMYPEIGLKIGLDMTIIGEKGHPIEAIWVDALPPWECLWDRRARSRRQMRYFGHVYWIGREELVQRFPEVADADITPMIAPDVVEDGTKKANTKNPSELRDDQQVRILEFYDLTCGETEKDQQFRIYILEGVKGGRRLLKSMEMPFDDVTGHALCNLIPGVFVNVPEHPMRGIAPVASLYEINSEQNYTHTFLMNAARRDSARHLLARKNALDEEAMSKLTSGNDMEVVGVEGEDNLDRVASWLKTAPLSTALLKVMEALLLAQEKVAGTSPLTRGQALKYASAAEIHSLVGYDESTLGRIRKRMDVMVVALLKLFLRVLAAAMDEASKTSITVLVEEQEVVVERAWLDEDWEIAIADAASTPLAEAQKRQDLQLILPVLMQLYPLAQQPGPIGTAARAIIRYVVQIYELPSDMGIDALQAAPSQETAAGASPPGVLPSAPPGPDAAGSLPVPTAATDPAGALRAAVDAGVGGA